VKFLVDHQLPPLLAGFLQSRGFAARHVRELGLDSDDDTTIWKYAIEHEFILISKDEDFFHLANRPDEKGKLVWVRLEIAGTGLCWKHSISHYPKLLIPSRQVIELSNFVKFNDY
jgi:predicted nuclease of predicted toxin-antitoxin system